MSVIKLKGFEVPLGANVTVSNTTTTVGFGRYVRLINTNTTIPLAATLLSANSANLNQTTAYANVTIPPSTVLLITKASTDFVTGNASILAVNISVVG